MDLSNPITIILITVFSWWLTTGVVLFLNRLPQNSFKFSLAGGFIVLALSFAGLIISRDMATNLGAAIAFFSALGAWSFVELTFYLGYVTGPRKRACPPGCKGWPHFIHALQVSLHHEALIGAITFLTTIMTQGHDNQLGLWAFVILWAAHESARLNVFLGVRNVSEEWVPKHLPFLKSFLRKKAFNPFFPISQLIAILALFIMIDAINATPPDNFDATVLIFLSSLVGLAIVEHWFLILPIPLTGLWHFWLKIADNWASSETATKTVRLKREMSSPLERSNRVTAPASVHTSCADGSQTMAHPINARARIFSRLGRWQ